MAWLAFSRSRLPLECGMEGTQAHSERRAPHRACRANRQTLAAVWLALCTYIEKQIAQEKVRGHSSRRFRPATVGVRERAAAGARARPRPRLTPGHAARAVAGARSPS